MSADIFYSLCNLRLRHVRQKPDANVPGMNPSPRLMSRESLLEELRGQDGIISTYNVTGAVNEENRRNFSGNSVDGAVHVVCSTLDDIPPG
jgi:hypothetical protein